MLGTICARGSNSLICKMAILGLVPRRYDGHVRGKARSAAGCRSPFVVWHAP